MCPYQLTSPSRQDIIHEKPENEGFIGNLNRGNFSREEVSPSKGTPKVREHCQRYRKPEISRANSLNTVPELHPFHATRYHPDGTNGERPRNDNSNQNSGDSERKG
jgi:hypothetical protein